MKKPWTDYAPPFTCENDELTVQFDTADKLQITIVIPSGLCSVFSQVSNKDARRKANNCAIAMAQSRCGGVGEGRLVKA